MKDASKKSVGWAGWPRWMVVGNALWKSKAQHATAYPAPAWPPGAWVVLRGEESASLRLALAGPAAPLAAAAVGDGDWRAAAAAKGVPAEPGAPRPAPAATAFLGAIVDVWGQPPPAWLSADVTLRGRWLWARAQGPLSACAMVQALVRHGHIRCVVVRGADELAAVPPWPARHGAGPPELLQQCRRSGTSLVATSSLAGQPPGPGRGPEGCYGSLLAWASLRVQT